MAIFTKCIDCPWFCSKLNENDNIINAYCGYDECIERPIISIECSKFEDYMNNIGIRKRCPIWFNLAYSV